MKILSVVGARPQFIKAAVVSRSIESANEKRDRRVCDEVLLHTGQHFDDNMSDIFFRELNIPVPAYHLGIANATHGKMTGRMLEGIEQVLLQEHPDLVLVYGDTNSTLAGALAAVKLNIPLAHVESGLRSDNLAMPEEINRIVTDRVANLLFCPTALAVANLAKEGVDASRVFRVGDVMLDAALYYRDKARLETALQSMLADWKGRYSVATVHRAENTDDPVKLGNIMAALNEVAAAAPVILPLHPRTRKRLQENAISCGRVTVVDPLGYFEMMALVRDCEVVFTDSGGLQKEAFFFSKPCITLRQETEWQELVDIGVNVIAGSNSESILGGWKELRERQLRWDLKPYGEGDAGTRIVDILLDYGGSPSPKKN